MQCRCPISRRELLVRVYDFKMPQISSPQFALPIRISNLHLSSRKVKCDSDSVQERCYYT
ncbi:hypothetical protein AKJ16_DCAP02620 [Drosera capensis]